MGVYPRAGMTSYTVDHMRNKDAFNYLQLALFKVAHTLSVSLSLSFFERHKTHEVYPFSPSYRFSACLSEQ